jgi:hypothetical protein
VPQVLTDPSLTSIIVNEGTDLFSWPNVARPSVLSLQAPQAQPLPPGTATATGLLSPDLQVPPQLVNFPSSVYDTSPGSLLTLLMQALLGAGGAGQLRKRQLVARLQQAITSTRFYDLDSFYGALFGAQRGPAGAIPVNPATGAAVNPYSDLASPDGWDAVEAADALYRERVIALARAITLGGTVPGIRAIAEAVTSSECQVYEMWRLTGGAPGPPPGGLSWAQVAAQYPLWSAFPAGTPWQSVEGIPAYTGLLAGNAPGEVVIVPSAQYPPTTEGLARQSADYYAILAVAEVLKPASCIVSVIPGPTGVLVPVPARSAWSPSQYWEVVTVVTPPASSSAYSAIAGSYQGPSGSSLPPGSYVTPSPPLSRSSGFECSYAPDVTAVTARAVTGADPNDVTVTDGQDFQSVTFRPQAGGTVQYLPQEAVIPVARAAAARAASSVAVKAAPWSGPRVPVMRSS